MALPNTTTLSAAVGINDTTILLASVTDVALGNLIQIEGEFVKVIAPLASAASVPQPVLRGQEGTAQVAHVTGIQVKLGANPSAVLGVGDWGMPTPGSAQPVIKPVTKPTRRREYVADGALVLPGPGENMTAVLDGTVALAMTLAQPTVLNDGDRLVIIGTGKAAHTITLPNASGLGNVGGAADVITFKADQSQAISLVAGGGFWVNESLVAGAATVAGPGLG